MYFLCFVVSGTHLLHWGYAIRTTDTEDDSLIRTLKVRIVNHDSWEVPVTVLVLIPGLQCI